MNQLKDLFHQKKFIDNLILVSFLGLLVNIVGLFYAHDNSNEHHYHHYNEEKNSLNNKINKSEHHHHHHNEIYMLFIFIF